MRLTFVILSLRCGGAERVLASLANHWAQQGHDVAILTFDGASESSFFPLDERISRVSLASGRRPVRLGSPRSWLEAIRQIVWLRRALRKRCAGQAGGHAVISFWTYCNLVTLVASTGFRARRIVSDRNDPSSDTTLLRVLKLGVYGMADRIVVLAEAWRRRFPFWLRRKTRVVPNAIRDLRQEPAAGAATGRDRRSLLAVGRLVQEKAFDDLIAVFHRLAPQFPDWDLRIAGDGPLKPALERQVRGLNLERRVFLLGEISDPGRLYRDADLFALSSITEGFPNVLGEAMAAGRAVIATDCGAGVREMVRHGVDGWLVRSSSLDELSAGLRRLMGDEALRSELGRSAVSVAERFSVDRALSGWNEAIGDGGRPS